MNDEKPEEVDLKDLPPEDQEQRRKGAIEYVRTVGIVEKQKASAKKRQRKPGKMHAPGAHWYELQDFFDPHLIETTPIENSGFMMGILEEFAVVEYDPNTMTREAMTKMGERLNAMGIKAMMVPKGVRFMRLCGVSEEQEKQMNAMLADRVDAEKRNLDS